MAHKSYEEMNRDEDRTATAFMVFMLVVFIGLGVWWVDSERRIFDRRIDIVRLELEIAKQQAAATATAATP